MTKKWPFSDPPETVCVTTKDVTDGNQPILYVCHELDEDGENLWHFYIGENAFDMDAAQLVSLKTIYGLDKSIADLAELAVGSYATRKTGGGAWEVSKCES